MAYENKKEMKESCFTLIVKSFMFYLFESANDNVKSREADSVTGPEATMVAAAKHFSLKVRFCWVQADLL